MCCRSCTELRPIKYTFTVAFLRDNAGPGERCELQLKGFVDSPDVVRP